nr:hypothetical protein [Candidatus Sigynarchaeum springense]
MAKDPGPVIRHSRTTMTAGCKNRGPARVHPQGAIRLARVLPSPCFFHSFCPAMNKFKSPPGEVPSSTRIPWW